jgi:hypothetical protein
VIYNKDEYENGNAALELDMKFDKALPISTEVAIQLDLTDTSVEGIAKIFIDVHSTFKINDCNFSKYSLFGENNGKTFMVYGVTPADIESGELVSLLEKAKNNDGKSGIGFQINQ